MSHDLSQLTNRYNAYIHEGIPRLRRLGYNPFQFLEMVQSAGDAVQATKRLLADPRHTSYGFQRLYTPGWLVDSVEFAALLPWFEPLFTVDERQEARTRLILHDFPVDAKLRAATSTPPAWVEEQCLKPVDDLGRAYLPKDALTGIKQARAPTRVGKVRPCSR